MALLIDRPPDYIGSAGEAGRLISAYPRLRYMGSKYRVMPYLLDIFQRLDFSTALDAFSGSGVVAYGLKALGASVTTNDYLTFAETVATATIANSCERLDALEIDAVASGPNRDGRDFIERTFDGVFFDQDDNRFLDAAWSHLELLESPAKRAIAISALCLAAVRKQPRGVFTVAGQRHGAGYDDGRRNLALPLRDQFRLTVASFNAAVFDNGMTNTASCGDIMSLARTNFDLVYVDPPYSPPKYDNDYIKRYHFLEGLSTYWHSQTIMQHTLTRKLPKRFTAFGYQHSFEAALRAVIEKFASSTIVMSYSSNSWLGEDRIVAMLESIDKSVTAYSFPYSYTFGTHAAAVRRSAHELIFVAT